MRWFVVQTQSRAENKAEFHLRRQAFDAFLPRYRKRRRHARRTDWVNAPLFPGYLFVRLDTALTQWRPILSTVGVRDLIRFGDRPTPVPVGLVEEISRRRNAAGLLEIHQPAPFEQGESVRILSGPLTNAVGLFDCEDDDQRVMILLDMMGRQVRVRVPLETVAACA